MASLFALGVMSLAWMAFVAALIAAREAPPVAPRRDLRNGRRPARAGRAPARGARRDPGSDDSGQRRLDERHAEGCRSYGRLGRRKSRLPPGGRRQPQAEEDADGRSDRARPPEPSRGRRRPPTAPSTTAAYAADPHREPDREAGGHPHVPRQVELAQHHRDPVRADDADTEQHQRGDAGHAADVDEGEDQRRDRDLREARASAAGRSRRREADRSSRTRPRAASGRAAGSRLPSSARAPPPTAARTRAPRTTRCCAVPMMAERSPIARRSSSPRHALPRRGPGRARRGTAGTRISPPAASRTGIIASTPPQSPT